jgi:hypothetical protein
MTTLWGGVGLAVGGVLWILADAGPSFPHIVSAAVWEVVAGAVVCAAAVILAVGLGRETGIVGRSAWGVMALFLFGARNLTLSSLGWLATRAVAATGSASAALIAANTTLIVFFALATLVAAISVVRAGVLHGFARWTLMAVACRDLLAAAVLFAYSEPLESTLGYLGPLLIIVAGLSYALHGRSAQVRALAKTVNARW